MSFPQTQNELKSSAVKLVKSSSPQVTLLVKAMKGFLKTAPKKKSPHKLFTKEPWTP